MTSSYSSLINKTKKNKNKSKIIFNVLIKIACLPFLMYIHVLHNTFQTCWLFLTVEISKLTILYQLGNSKFQLFVSQDLYNYIIPKSPIFHFRIVSRFGRHKQQPNLTSPNFNQLSERSNNHQNSTTFWSIHYYLISCQNIG